MKTAAKYTLRIEAEDGADDEDTRRLLEEVVPMALENALDVINDNLPEGYYCKFDEA